MTPDQHNAQKDLVRASLLSQPVKPEIIRPEVEARMWSIRK